jgi:hypothetical protein
MIALMFLIMGQELIYIGYQNVEDKHMIYVKL